tara:strand:+ start:38 stop:820 length:783 start_codon:yes stop_codon:yes gene_type:complete
MKNTLFTLALLVCFSSFGQDIPYKYKYDPVTGHRIEIKYGYDSEGNATKTEYGYGSTSATTFKYDSITNTTTTTTTIIETMGGQVGRIGILPSFKRRWSWADSPVKKVGVTENGSDIINYTKEISSKKYSILISKVCYETQVWLESENKLHYLNFEKSLKFSFYKSGRLITELIFSDGNLENEIVFFNKNKDIVNDFNYKKFFAEFPFKPKLENLNEITVYCEILYTSFINNFENEENLKDQLACDHCMFSKQEIEDFRK